MRPLLKVVALASEHSPDAALLALETKLAAADQAWEALYREQTAAEDTCFAAAPPPPTEPAALDPQKFWAAVEARDFVPLLAHKEAWDKYQSASRILARSPGAGGARLRPHGGRGSRQRCRPRSPRNTRRDRFHASKDARRPDFQGAIRGGALSRRPRRRRHALDRRGSSRHRRGNLSEATGSFAAPTPVSLP